nr:STAS domain-containing protein [Sphaerisporangium rubeum]
MAVDVLYEDAHLRVTRTSDGWVRVTGEVDLSNSAAFGAALTRLSALHGPLDVDVAGLRFVDLSGLRSLVQPDSSAAEGPARLHNVPVHVRRLMSLLGWDPAGANGSGLPTMP